MSSNLYLEQQATESLQAAQTYRIQIPKLSDTEHRPLWSVMIPTYNCARYLSDTLKGILAQDPGAEVMQIEVIDDCSTSDDPEAIVRELAGDRVAFFRQPQNVGYIRNFETCLLRAKGQLIHILHGDDGVRSGFYERLQSVFATHSNIGLAYCRHIFMDEEGHWDRISVLEQPSDGILNNAFERLVTGHPIQTPSVVVRRAVYENLGGFDRRINYSGEDWEMWCRIASQYQIGYVAEPLALYRGHQNSLSGRSVRAGLDLENVHKAYQMVMAYVPPVAVSSLSKRAARFWALCGLDKAIRFTALGDWHAVKAQTWQALRFDHSLHMLLTFTFYLGVATIKHIAQAPSHIASYSRHKASKPMQQGSETTIAQPLQQE